MIEYVIHKFINTPQQVPLSLPKPLIIQPIASVADTHRITWTKEEMDTLYWYYIQSKSSSDVIGSVIKLFEENGNKSKPRIAVIQQLSKQDIISLSEFDDLMMFEDSEYVRSVNPLAPVQSDVQKTPKPIDDIKLLKDRLIKEDKGVLIQWLQKFLMECCLVKLKLNPPSVPLLHDKLVILEPIQYHCICK